MSYDIDDVAFLGKSSSGTEGSILTEADLKLVNPKILHFTIRFLGEIDETDKSEIISALRNKVENFELVISFRGSVPSRMSGEFLSSGLE